MSRSVECEASRVALAHKRCNPTPVLCRLSRATAFPACVYILHSTVLPRDHCYLTFRTQPTYRLHPLYHVPIPNIRGLLFTNRPDNSSTTLPYLVYNLGHSSPKQFKVIHPVFALFPIQFCFKPKIVYIYCKHLLHYTFRLLSSRKALHTIRLIRQITKPQK